MKIKDTGLLGQYIRFYMYEGHEHQVEIIGKVDGMRYRFQTEQYLVCGEWWTMEWVTGLDLVELK